MRYYLHLYVTIFQSSFHWGRGQWSLALRSMSSSLSILFSLRPSSDIWSLHRELLLSILFSLRHGIDISLRGLRYIPFNPLFIEADYESPPLGPYDLTFNPLFIEAQPPSLEALFYIWTLSILFSLRRNPAKLRNILHQSILSILFSLRLGWNSQSKLDGEAGFQSSFHWGSFVASGNGSFSVNLSILFSLRQVFSPSCSPLPQLSFQSSFHWGLH